MNRRGVCIIVRDFNRDSEDELTSSESDEESWEEEGSVWSEVTVPRPVEPWRRRGGWARRNMSQHPGPQQPGPQSESSQDDNSDYVERHYWGPVAAVVASSEDESSDEESWRCPPQAAVPPPRPPVASTTSWRRTSSSWRCNPPSPEYYDAETTGDEISIDEQEEDEEEEEDDRSPSPPRQRRRMYSPSSPQVDNRADISPELWQLAARIAHEDDDDLPYPPPWRRRPPHNSWNGQHLRNRSPPPLPLPPSPMRRPIPLDSFDRGRVLGVREAWRLGVAADNTSDDDDSSSYEEGMSEDSSVQFNMHRRSRRPWGDEVSQNNATTSLMNVWPPVLPEIDEDMLKILCKERKLDPETFICPITRSPMRSPAVACDGHTYDKSAIERWLTRNDKSPITGVQMMRRLVPNLALRTLMHTLFCEDC